MKNESQSKAFVFYGGLQSRRVDLIGDFAGRELFLIDGDSLLLRLFSDPSLDFDNGFQILHLVFNVESFLKQLLDRRANFHLIWFDANQDLCVPATKAGRRNAYKYRFARRVVGRHIDDVIKQTDAKVQSHRFVAHDSEEALRFYASSGAYFMMSHDGGSIGSNKTKDIDVKQSNMQKIELRRMIRTFVTNGMSVALINEVTFRDTKVMAQIVESAHASSSSLYGSKVKTSALQDTALPSVSGLNGTVHEVREEDKALLEQLKKASAAAPLLPVSQRAFLLIHAAKTLLQKSTISQQLAAALLLHMILLQALPLSSRRLPSGQLPESTSANVEVMSDDNTVADSTRTPSEDDDRSDEETDQTSETELSETEEDLEHQGRDIVDSSLPKLVNAVDYTLTFCSGAVDSLECDIADVIDIRLLRYTFEQHQDVFLSSESQKAYHALCKIVGVEPLATAKSAPGSAQENVSEDTDDTAVLPFSNEYFDTHLADIKLTVARREPKESPITAKIFEDLTHWHSARKPLNKKAANLVTDKRQMRREQLYLAEMAAYAASLTNAVGKSLDPEIIAVDSSKKASKPQQRQLDIRPKAGASKPAAKDNQPPKKKKMTPQEAQKLARMEKEMVNREAKQDKAGDKLFDAWKLVRGRLDHTKDGMQRFVDAEAYVAALPADKRMVLQAEVKIYALASLLEAAASMASQSTNTRQMNILAHAISVLRDTASLPNLSIAEVKALSDIAKAVKAPLTAPSSNDVRRKLSFELKLPKSTPAVEQDWKEFQLNHGGPYMDRSLDAVEDDRVPFKPDAWQRQVLDELDKDNSVFVVAPTSAGKTFISFYAMRKILASDDDGVLVYLAPTKALVNQIAAEVQSRFTKRYPHAGSSVWAIHTRDHRINNPAGCQILVTVPHILQIMLMAPENAKTWAPRVKRIIFDEIHCIGQAEDGLVWEQLLLLAPCPIIALSATVGNSDEFSSWMSSTQKSLGNELTKVEHKHRYSDLRKFIYHPPTEFKFNALPAPGPMTQMGIENPDYFSFVHPVASLINRSRGMPEDLSLESRDCLTLYEAMKAVQTLKFPVDAALAPKNLPEHIIKADVINWETKLKAVLHKWLLDPESPFDKLVSKLNGPTQNLDKSRSLVSGSSEGLGPNAGNDQTEDIPSSGQDEFLEKTTLPLLVSLEMQRALPAILFNYDRSHCEDICKYVLEKLATAESRFKDSSPSWTKKLADFKKWTESKAAAAKKGAKISKKSKNADDEGMSKTDRAMMAGSEDVSEFETFDPEAPLDAYSFADKRRLRADELKVYTDKLKWRSVDQYLIDALWRGIGVHHAGMNRAYRQTVEVLFRKGFLRVIIATGTLALGINMPCKTVVFSGDSVFLTALNYRQAAGRAGRRGFDLLGNVVFHGLPTDKIYRLLSSRLPDLNGHFPVTTTLVLRLFSLLHNSDFAPYARQAVNALLSQPRIYLGADAFRQQVLHHLRFSIDYLRRQNMLAPNGAPINFAGTVSHLYYTENSGFAFHVLLKKGYFHSLAKTWQSDHDKGKLKLMLVMSHIFGRQLCKVSDREYKAKNLKMSSSTVFLQALPKEAREILEEHNATTRQIFTTYVRTFVDQHLEVADQHLPLSGLTFNGTQDPPKIASLPSPAVRSAFVALSGHGDDFDSVGDLCSTVRSGVFLEKAVVPHLDIYPDASGHHLNAYLYDYFVNCDLRAVLEDNGIRRSDIWFVLNDFSLVLATIVASLTNYLRARAMSELDMMDLKGGGEMKDINKDDESAEGLESADETKERLEKAKAAASAQTKVVKKKKVAASWDDEDVSSEEEEAGSQDDDDDEAPDSAAGALVDATGLKGVLNMFTDLKQDFDTKFRAMWA